MTETPSGTEYGYTCKSNAGAAAMALLAACSRINKTDNTLRLHLTSPPSGTLGDKEKGSPRFDSRPSHGFAEDCWSGTGLWS